MGIDEAARHGLYTKLEELLGDEPASTLMSLLPPVGWADVATKDDLRTLEHAMRVEIAAVRVEMADLRAELHDSQRRMTITLVGTMLSISGLTFAATAVF